MFMLWCYEMMHSLGKQMEMNMELQVTIKSVYGVERIYPANDTAHKFIALLGSASFTRRNIDHIKALGYTVTQVMVNAPL
jgi:hypothetical protein